MPFLPTWTPHLSVGNAMLDAQHITLLELSREMLRILADRPRNDEAIYALLRDIAQCYESHGELEEQVLAVDGSAALYEHRRRAELIRTELREQLASAKENTTDRTALAAAVGAWIDHHIGELRSPLAGS